MRRLAIIGAAGVLAACAGAGLAQGAGQAGQADAAPAAVSAAQDPGPPPGMPKPLTRASRPGATAGEALYLEHCAMCHGPSGMGWGLLARRGADFEPNLERREGLSANYVIQAARRGIGNMPPVPRGEVSDEELKAIADYLAAGPHGVAP